MVARKRKKSGYFIVGKLKIKVVWGDNVSILTDSLIQIGHNIGYIFDSNRNTDQSVCNSVL